MITKIQLKQYAMREIKAGIESSIKSASRWGNSCDVDLNKDKVEVMTKWLRKHGYKVELGNTYNSFRSIKISW